MASLATQRASSLVLLTLAPLVGCVGEYDVSVRFENAETSARASWVEVAIVQSCDSAVRDGPLRGDLQHVSFPIGSPAPALGAVEPAEYGLVGRAWDSNCQVVASGCRQVRLAANGNGDLRVELLDDSGSVCPTTSSCIEGVCRDDLDARVEAGFDATSTTDGGADAPLRDSGGSDVLDGGTRDAADSTPDAPAPTTFCERHAAPTVLACLDSEGDPSAAGWVTEGAGTLERAPGVGVTGNAYRASIGPGAAANLRHNSIGAHFTGIMWMRMKVRVAAGAAGRLVYATLFAAHDSTAAPYPVASTAISAGRTVKVDHTGETNTSGTSAEVYSPDTWFCVEAAIDNAAAGSVTIYLNGDEVLVEPIMGGSLWNTIFVGPRSVDPTQPALEFLFDDFVWSTSRVSCALE